MQWRRNEFESGGGAPIRHEALEEFFWSCPSAFLVLQVQLIVLLSAFVMVIVQFGQFLVYCHTHGAPPCPMESVPLLAICVTLSHRKMFILSYLVYPASEGCVTTLPL